MRKGFAVVSLLIFLSLLAVFATDIYRTKMKLLYLERQVELAEYQAFLVELRYEGRAKRNLRDMVIRENIRIALAEKKSFNMPLPWAPPEAEQSHIYRDAYAFNLSGAH